MGREKERQIKNFALYVLSAVVILASIYLKRQDLLADWPFIIVVFLGFIGLAESDFTDILEIYLKHKEGEL